MYGLTYMFGYTDADTILYIDVNIQKRKRFDKMTLIRFGLKKILFRVKNI